MPLRDLIPAPAIEAIHGVTVVDPYRWLEDRTSAETQQWLEEQKHAHDRYSVEFVASMFFDPASASI